MPKLKDNDKIEYYQKPRRRRPKDHKLLTFIIFAVLLFYLSGYLLSYLGKDRIPIETVDYGTIGSSEVFKGIIVRDEYIVSSDMKGLPVYNYADNERIKKNVTVCTVQNVEETADIEEELSKIEKSISDIQRERSDLSVFKDDVDRIERDISGYVNSTAFKFISGNISDAYAMKDQIKSQIGLRSQIWATENISSLSEITETKSLYEAQLLENTAQVKSATSGVLSLHIDKLESVLTPETISEITEEQTNMRVTPAYISRNQSVEAGDPIFKIVQSNIWYIASYIPNSIASGWENGQTKKIYTTINDEEKSTEAEIKEMSVGTEKTLVIFETDRNLIDFLDIRTMDFQVYEDISRGFKIPCEAIVEKTFIKLPIDCVVDNLGQSGVIKRTGVDSFVSVTISSQDEEYCYILQDFGDLKLGDTILKGTGAYATEYKLSEVSTRKGVYVVNSSIAKFKVIDIMEQNTDYAIVRTDSDYGIKIYDSIVSDAKNIKEGQTIY